MTEQKITKRPETFDDLDQTDFRYEPVTVFSLEVHVGRGVLAAAETLLDRLRMVHPELDLDTSGRTWTAKRPRNEDEKAKALVQAQAEWDRRDRERAEAEQRSVLKVGDDFDPGTVVSECSLIHSDGPPCSLGYGHAGDHIEVVAGQVATITPRRSR
ncbi:DUF7432 family protein [Amycolatopsis suaedae]|uniref:Uncharacterized protein n=1 Tax=Amycolatopsis suaedae TaxID=2510978 RepID=A0A4Q7IZA1_9PSEU|nr:hypothetical protein [Amycolatopsis suaedae]RZQ59809.1 hypothetical protein EWH70_32355 [Amycolatopsis suaedae]